MHCDAIEAGAAEHPGIKSKVEERIRNVPEATREWPVFNFGKTAIMNPMVGPVGSSIRPWWQGLPGRPPHFCSHYRALSWTIPSVDNRQHRETPAPLLGFGCER